MTLPTFWPLFWSGMCLLERWFGCAAEGAPLSAAQGSESTEALREPIRLRMRFPVLCQRSHPGRVIEASDVRGDERWEHARTVSAASRALRLQHGAAAQRAGGSAGETLQRVQLLESLRGAQIHRVERGERADGRLHG